MHVSWLLDALTLRDVAHVIARASRITLSSALAVLIAAPMAVSAQDTRIHLDGLQFQEQHDQFIAKYRDDSESFRSSARRASSLQIASSGVSAKL